MCSAGPDSLCGAGRTGDALSLAPMGFWIPRPCGCPSGKPRRRCWQTRRFYLCGASFVLNFRHVTGIKGQEALLDNGEALTLPRTAAVEFKRAWGDYWLKENARWIM